MDADDIDIEKLREQVRAIGLNISNDDRITPHDAALWLGISDATLRRLRDERRGPRAQRKTLRHCAWSYQIAELARDFWEPWPR